MVYAGVLAGGTGKRMQRSDLPKQFMPLGNKSVLSHTTEQFVLNPNIDKVFVPVPADWVSYTKDLFNKESVLGYKSGKIEIIQGGVDRNLTLIAAVNRIEELYGINPDDIIVSHDAVRPFITQRIINDNIELCKTNCAVNTVYTLADTPVVSDDGVNVLEIPVRSRIFLGQTPQTFNIRELKYVFASLTDEEKSILTDACKMFVIKEKAVKIVMGEGYNIKITTPFDYSVALMLIKGGVVPE